MGEVKSKEKPQESPDGCTVLWSLTAKFTPGVEMLLTAGEDRITVFGSVKRRCRLIQYNMRAKQLHATGLQLLPNGITEATLCGKRCVALSYGRQRTDERMRSIEFRDMSNLDKVIFNFKIFPHEPGCLCTSSPDILLYLDWATDACEVGWLDCSRKPVISIKTTRVQQGGTWGMCCVAKGDKQLLVTIQSSPEAYSGIYAYNMDTDKLEWSVKGQLPGNDDDMLAVAMTTDGQDHVFVSDRANACVQMFSARGVYMGAILEEGFGMLGEICWCDSISGLIVVHQKKKSKTTSISAIKVE